MFFFDCVDARYRIYVGRDKFENEDLIKYGWPEDVWFHVDKLSSAHVYLRMPAGETMDDIPEAVLHECCQLVKENSIEGCKAASVAIVYTPWSNLKKTADMAVGQVGFHSDKLVRRVATVAKDRDVVKRIEKTRREAQPDLAQERDDRDREERRRRNKEEAEARVAAKQAREQARAEYDQRTYKAVMREDKMHSNAEMSETYEDDFM